MVVDRRAGGGVLAVARPEHTELRGNLLVRDARIIRDAAFAGDAKLLEDLARMGEGEPGRPAKRARDVLDDAPVLPGIARAVNRLVDLDDAPFDLCDRPFVFLVQAPRQDDVGVPRGVVQEEVDGDVELELLEAPGDETVIRQGDLRVEADGEQPSDFSAIDLAEELVGIHAGARQVLFVDPPYAGDVAAVLRVADVAPPGQLIALLPMLAAALSVGLADDG